MSTTDDQDIRADERRRWSKIALMLALHTKRQAASDPSFERAWKMLVVFSRHLLNNDGPPGGDERVLQELAELFKDLGLAGPEV